MSLSVKTVPFEVYADTLAQLKAAENSKNNLQTEVMSLSLQLKDLEFKLREKEILSSMEPKQGVDEIKESNKLAVEE